MLSMYVCALIMSSRFSVCYLYFSLFPIYFLIVVRIIYPFFFHLLSDLHFYNSICFSSISILSFSVFFSILSSSPSLPFPIFFCPLFLYFSLRSHLHFYIHLFFHSLSLPVFLSLSFLPVSFFFFSQCSADPCKLIFLSFCPFLSSFFFSTYM